MGWKTLPAWIKGGIILFIVTAILGFLDYNCLMHNGGLSSLKCIPFEFQMVIAYPLGAFLIDKFPVSTQGRELFQLTIIISSVILWTIIGCLIGLIVGKFKKK